MLQRPGVELFAITSSTVNRFKKNLLPLETAMNCLQNTYIFRNLLKTSLYTTVW